MVALRDLCDEIDVKETWPFTSLTLAAVRKMQKLLWGSLPPEDTPTHEESACGQVNCFQNCLALVEGPNAA